MKTKKYIRIHNPITRSYYKVKRATNITPSTSIFKIKHSIEAEPADKKTLDKTQHLI